jgi:hypothetical protein
MKTDDSLSNIFDMEPMKTPEVIEGELVPVDVDLDIPSSSKVESDYDSSRDNLKSLLQTGQSALEHALEVAKQSEHPRAFEVVGNLIKQLADVNQQLLDVHQQKKKLDEPSKSSLAKQQVTNNSIFVGSTAELSNMIKKLQGE